MNKNSFLWLNKRTRGITLKIETKRKKRREMFYPLCIVIGEETRTQQPSWRTDVIETRNLGQTSPAHKELWESDAFEYHFKRLHQTCTPSNDVPNCSSYFFFFHKSQSKRGKTQREEPAAEPVRRRKSMGMMLILLHYLTLCKLAGRWTLCLEKPGSFHQEQQYGVAILSKNIHEQELEKGTKASMCCIRSPRL